MKKITPKPMEEVTPLTKEDCLLVFSREKSDFNFPLHTHKEFELNFIKNAKGAQRIVGDSVEVIDDLELTLITGEKLEHAWQTHQCTSKQIQEITIQFPNTILSKDLLNRNSFKTIDKLLIDAKRGVTFPRETIEKVRPQLESLSKQAHGFYAVLQLLNILYDLSLSPNARILASSSASNHAIIFESRRIDALYTYLQENYAREVTLDEAADLVNMSRVAFCRFIKRRTGKTFVEILNDIRLGHATNLLINTTNTISEVCFSCGFNNLSYFNRLFLKNKKCTPSELRKKYKKNRIII